MSVLLDRRASFSNSEYKYGYGKDGTITDKDGKKPIDCSHLVNSMLVSAGFDVPYQSTSELKESVYFDSIAPTDVVPGDLVLWLGENSHGKSGGIINHVGIVESYRVSTRSGTFFGSQNSTGPASAKFGTPDNSYYFPVATKFLRPKPELRAKSTMQDPGEKQKPEASVVRRGQNRAEIKFSYPFYQENGRPHQAADTVFNALADEPSGRYLIGKGNFFHGGIHITDKVAPHCKDKDMVRCIADGRVVAYRLNADYLESKHKGDLLKYSSSFCLVQHDYASPEGVSGEVNKLTFFSLYMHLAPRSAYGEATQLQCYEITATDLQVRSDAVIADNVVGIIEKGAQIDVEETREVQHNQNRYVFAKGKLKKGRVKSKSSSVVAKPGDSVWVALEKKGEKGSVFAKQITSADTLVPAYWNKSPELDQVVVCNVPINAGDKIGRLGLNDVVINGAGGKTSKYQIHLEVFSFDSRLKSFLQNAANVKQGAICHFVPKGTPLCVKIQTDGKVEFKSDSAVTGKDLAFSSPVPKHKDGEGKDWLEIEFSDQYQECHGYVAAEKAEMAGPHDWLKMGYQTLEAPAGFDGYLPPILPPMFYKQLYQAVAQQPAAIERDAIRAVLTGKEYQNTWSKVIVRQVSDWKHRSDHSVWAVFDRIMQKSPDMVAHERERIDNCVWWDDVAAKVLGFDKSGVVWHFHPVGFVKQMLSCVESGSVEIAWGRKVASDFKMRVIEICAELGVQPDYLMSCMAFETGETFSPSIKNAAGSGAVGLIQFMASTAKSLGSTTDLLVAMSAVEQLEYVKKYFWPHRNKLKSLEDVYMAILYPAAIGKPLDHVLFSDPSKAYIQNKGFDKNKDKKITIEEVSFKVRSMFEKGLKASFYG